MEQICTNCKHARTGHSKKGCGELLRNGQECKCSVKYMDQGKFIMGVPKKEW